ncbi:hypothetical protein ILUMI_23184 [Ignelater luminosus]|uniref:Uncharacterized protein n=1 Tax=Ignelater luminosus TaxID=2038154 RepID=A0A8K0CCX1_IGNLU|nr:hypothetical protein ILUMI_23184 [Ignelater luminosus]
MSINQNLQKMIENFSIRSADSSSNFLGSRRKSEEETFEEKIKSLCGRMNTPLSEDDLKQAIKDIYNSAIAKKLMCDTYTQYSVTNFTQNEEVPIQSSLLLSTYNDAFEYTSPSTTTSSQMFLTPFSKIPELSFSPILKSTKSSDTVLPKSTTSLTTDFSNTVASNPSEDPSHYKVPSNTPSSCAELHVSDVKIKNVKNDIDLSLNSRGIEKITLTYKKPEKSKVPITIKPNNSCKTEALQTEEFPFDSHPTNIIQATLIAPQKKLCDFSSPEDELISTELECLTKQTGTENVKKDKTLELLECARCKLLIYLNNQDKEKKRPEQDLIDVCGLHASDVDCDEMCPKNFTEIRNVSVCLNNPFNPYQKREDGRNKSEHCEKHRRDNGRNYNVNHRSGRSKRNYNNHYTSGDNLDRHLDSEFSKNAVFQVYPLVFNNNAFGMESVEIKSKQKSPHDGNVSKTDSSESKDSINVNVIEDSVGYKLSREFNSLQNMYDDMCASMRLILDIPETPSKPSQKFKKNYGKIETIGDDLMNTFGELKTCLSTINRILSESEISVEINNVYPKDDDLGKLSSNVSISSENHEDRHHTYFTMENEIERTIKELLKESEYIRETVILNGGKEEAEPPFSFEYIDRLNDPYSVCKKIFEDIINSSVPAEFKKDSKEKPEGPQADINYILNILLEEVEKNNLFLDKPNSPTVDTTKMNKDNFLSNVKSRINRTNLQSGDINSNNNSLFDPLGRHLV